MQWDLSIVPYVLHSCLLEEGEGDAEHEMLVHWPLCRNFGGTANKRAYEGVENEFLQLRAPLNFLSIHKFLFV